MADYADSRTPAQGSAPQPTNGMGLVGFVTSILGLFTCGLLNVISLPLSLIGLLWKPRGFAIAGTIISLFGTGLLALVGFSMILVLTGFKKTETPQDQTANTSLRIQEASDIINQFQKEHNALPDAIEGRKLIIEKKDAWGETLDYDLDEPNNSFVIRSAGPDKQFDTPDDVTSKSKQFDTSEVKIDFGGEGMSEDGPAIIPPGAEASPTPEAPESTDKPE
ncbi:MAG TPA: DUF4190 domain-containing protein [Pirellulaceae bacterium]|nr:DUF4190 domain-containing protein [Pirellulaceae bacterium]